MPLNLPTDAEFEALSSVFEEEGYAAPASDPRGCYYKPYRPPMNPIQAQGFDEIKRHKYILVWGERMSAKSYLGILAMVDHCRENFNARALVIVPTGRQGEEGGCWHKLNTEVRGDYERNGGTIFTDPRQNKYKDTYIWISNKFGGWSRVVLISMPYEGFVAPRVKGIEPSFILVDEAQTLDTDTYFKHLVQQLGLDRRIKHKAIVYTANPAGPSHWLYDRFFVKPVDEATGKWNDNYYVLHLPRSDNERYVPDGYVDTLLDCTKGDETEHRRMVIGEWVDAPSGDSLFRNDYNELIHVKGDAVKGEGLLPWPGQPLLVLGYDLGQAHSSVTLEQYIPFKDKIHWLILDELVFVDAYMPYSRLVPKILELMKYWSERMKYEFQFQHISDDSAFNQFRAKDGSVDVKDVEELSGGKIRMVPAPKGKFSIDTRVRLTREKLQNVELLVSATCTKTRESMLKLECDPNNPLRPKPKSRFGHPFASMSYPFIYYAGRGQTSMRPRIGEVSSPSVYAAA